jgi:hypothetical protein
MRFVLGRLSLLTSAGGSRVGKEVRGRVVVVGSVEARLDELLALAQSDHGLELRRGERVDVTSLGSNQYERLGPSKSRQLISLEALLLEEPRPKSP